MNLVAPKLPDYDVDEWRRLPFALRVKRVCGSWAVDGYGTPLAVYGFYLLKIGLYVGLWLWFCSCSVALGSPSDIGTWWYAPEALAKAVLWSMAYEALGLGCGSGPLTGRYLPPITAFLHFLRPGTTKLPLFPGLPVLGGDRRTLLDVLFYLAHYVFLARALVAPELTPGLLLPTVVLLPLMTLGDKTLGLASRGEHYYVALLCFLVPDDALAGVKSVWLVIWLGAATSKLNRHFPSVVCVMISNSPVLGFGWLRRRMYRAYPDDLRPSRLAHFMAHAGTVTELAFPILLATSSGGMPTLVGLAVMLGFHTFITSNVPMGVPIEWNVIMVYGGFVLFGHHAHVAVFDVAHPLLLIALLVFLVVLPIVGNLVPRLVSFLVSMRYYAGNWAYSVWLFRGDAEKKLDQHLVKSALTTHAQLRRLYDEKTTVAILSKVIAFRHMHLHGRALQDLVPKAVGDVDAYAWYDGEIVAGLALGWNFGDGHLHDEQLLAAIQAQCRFEPGELRVIMVEAQPFFQPRLTWRIHDAKGGRLDAGVIEVSALADKQPWREPL